MWNVAKFMADEGKTHCIHCTEMEFFIKNFFRTCDQIRSLLWIWSHLLKKSLMKNFNFCAVILSKYKPKFLKSCQNRTTINRPLKWFLLNSSSIVLPAFCWYLRCCTSLFVFFCFFRQFLNKASILIKTLKTKFKIA